MVTVAELDDHAATATTKPFHRYSCTKNVAVTVLDDCQPQGPNLPEAAPGFSARLEPFEATPLREGYG